MSGYSVLASRIITLVSILSLNAILEDPIGATGRAPFSFSVTADMRNFAGSGSYDTTQFYRGACEAISAVGPGAFMISPGDIDPPNAVKWTIEQYIDSAYVWYPVVGNHESETPEDMDWLRLYNPDGTALPGIVNPGPINAVETCYSFDYENVHFAVINEYYDGLSDTGTDGDVSDPLYNWLVADLAATSQELIFVIGHEPAYVQRDQDCGSLRHLGDSLDQWNHVTNRDRFWTLLQDYNVVAYLTGHTHTYSAVNLYGVWQIDAGHARGLGDSVSRSTFVMIHVNGPMVTYETYRDDAHGGPYGMADSGYLAGGPVPTPTPACSDQPLCESGATWKYLDTGIDPGSTWADIGFDDSGWAEGASQLGYGDGDESTGISYGPDANDKYMTTWFRHHFFIADASEFTELTLNLLRDDGAVVYLNGLEVFRSNMPATSFDSTSPACVTVDNEFESMWFQETIPMGLLLTGENVISAEIHQNVPSSSDISFDLTLSGCHMGPTPTSTATPSPDIPTNSPMGIGLLLILVPVFILASQRSGRAHPGGESK